MPNVQHIVERCLLAPRKMMVHASPISTPEKWMSLSSPIMISSISLQLPSLTASGLSNVEAISPPAGSRCVTILSALTLDKWSEIRASSSKV